MHVNDIKKYATKNLYPLLGDGLQINSNPPTVIYQTEKVLDIKLFV